MIGVDIVSIARIDSAIQRHGKKFLHRFLNENEINMAKTAQTAAGFWAAKEAISKALGTGIGKDLSFLDIYIYKNKRGAPYFKISNNLIKEYNIESTALSIAHDAGFAIAVAVIKSAASDKV